MQPIFILLGCHRIAFISLLILSLLVNTSCQKYLDRKPLQNLAVPSSLNDLQALLDNQTWNISSPGYSEFVADNYYLSEPSWNSAQPEERTHYIWERNAITPYEWEWYDPYQAIYTANFVLDFLPKILLADSDKEKVNQIKGSALFLRAFMFHQLAQLYCRPYSTSSGTDLGIVLRLTSAVEAKSSRATVELTYEQIIKDIKTAAELLPIVIQFTTRPSKKAAFGALARVYLSMRDYQKANAYADSCLALDSTLLDYNDLIPINNPRLPNFNNNPEILYLSTGRVPPYLMGLSRQGIIDSSLYQSYNSNDLRKNVFFGEDGGVHYWRGSYFPDKGSYWDVFTGIAIDEIYLIRSECRARAGNFPAAIADLNALLRKRWLTGTFVDLDPADALNKILIERRKELVFRGLRWSDLRRFNLEGADLSIARKINTTTYTLPPNDLRWTLLIPDLEIIRSGITQNPR